MNALFRLPMTVDDYLAWAERQGEPGRCELFNGQVVAVAPERSIHRRLKSRVWRLLQTAVEDAGLACVVEPDGATVRIDEHNAYEPDALVYCGAPLPGHTMEVPAPVIVVEVLSKSTRLMDTTAKLAGHFMVASVEHYLIVDPDACTLAHWRRSDGVPALVGMLSEGELQLAPPGIAIRVERVFAD